MTQTLQSKTRPSGSTRRRILFGGGVAILTAGAVSARWFNIWAETGDTALSAPDAHKAAITGDIILVDIRRPDEWSLTGVGEGAVLIDMRRPDFVDALSAAVNGDHDRPIALICARGVRSRRLGAQLAQAGFSAILDVSEGMLGSGAGPGWVKRGLPVVRVN